MKRINLIATLLLVGLVNANAAKTGYHIHLKFTNIKDSTVFLVHYYGKGLPTIYKRDSAVIDKKGNAEFNTTDSTFVGGIYMMLLSDHKTNFEFLLNSGDDITITATVPDTAAKGKPADPVKLVFKNSPENVRFQGYVDFLKTYSTQQQGLLKQLSEAKTAEDTAAVRKEGSKSSHDLTNYRRKYVKDYPGTLLAQIFNGLEVPEVPEGPHFLEDGVTKDSTFAYKYYKSHFWDGFDFQDDRLIHTPILDSKLDEYFSKMILPYSDSVEHEADILLHKAKGTKDIFKYVLWWVTRYVENSKVMGMDEAFVYIVENYYMKGDAFWLTNEELEKYIDRAHKIAPNVIGNIAPEVRVPNIFSGKDESMLALKGNYTLVIFYSPTCGHCQKELPEIDSLYDAVLKQRGVTVFTVATEGEEKAITDFLKKIKVDEKWTNCWDHDHTGDWRGKYDVYSTPTIYLLDEKKIIRGKRLDHTNIVSVMDMAERKAKEREKNKSKK